MWMATMPRIHSKPETSARHFQSHDPFVCSQCGPLMCCSKYITAGTNGEILAAEDYTSKQPPTSEVLIGAAGYPRDSLRLGSGPRLAAYPPHCCIVRP